MAEQIVEKLLKALDAQINTDIAQSTAEQLRRWSGDVEKILLSGTSIPNFREEDLSSSLELLCEAADKLHASIVSIFGPTVERADRSCVDTEVGGVSLRAANAVSSSVDSNLGNDQYFEILAELLRAAGLLMRWHQTSQTNIVLSTMKNPMVRLKNEGMIRICMNLLDLDVPPVSPDVPRFASIYLFRATYGDDALTVNTRKSFVDSSDGCTCLMKALLKGDQPISRIFSLVRNVHHLITVGSSSIDKMNQAVEMLTTDIPKENTAKHDLLEVLVATMSWAVRSKAPFPGDAADRRADLVLEILRALFALDAGISSKTRYSENSMTQIGILLCDLLKLSSADARVYECKLAIVALMLNAPKEYAGYLAENSGIEPLVDILAYQLSLVVIERTRSSAEDAATAVPILLVLQKLAQANSTALKIVKDKVFPPEAEEVFQEKVKAEMVNQTTGQVKAKNMAPLDAPKGTLRWKLICLMTWTDSNVKRSGCELLWTLCDDDPTQFVLRTGFGNAVHFLGIKGCVTLPAEVNS